MLVLLLKVVAFERCWLPLPITTRWSAMVLILDFEPDIPVVFSKLRDCHQNIEHREEA